MAKKLPPVHPGEILHNYGDSAVTVILCVTANAASSRRRLVVATGFRARR